MGVLTCSDCKAKIEAENFEQADELIDHSIGVIRGKPCSGSPLNLIWDEEGFLDKDKKYEPKDPKSVASIVYHIGPGSKNYKNPGARKSDESKSKNNTPSPEGKKDQTANYKK